MAEIWNAQLYINTYMSQRKVYTVTNQPVTFVNARGCQIQYCGYVCIYFKNGIYCYDPKDVVRRSFVLSTQISAVYLSPLQFDLLASQFFQQEDKDKR